MKSRSGHTQLVLMQNHFDYKLLGKTADDAVGEAFDKVAKILGLPYPGGPSVAAAALTGDPGFIKLPKANLANYNFSFSGLKTAVLRAAQAIVGKDYTLPSGELPGLLNKSQANNLAASFQLAAVNSLVEPTLQAIKEFNPASVALAGGVAANQLLRQRLSQAISLPLALPDIKLCTDNAAMVASLGYFMANAGETACDPYKMPVLPGLSM